MRPSGRSSHPAAAWGSYRQAEFGQDSRLVPIQIDGPEMLMDEALICLRERSGRKACQGILRNRPLGFRGFLVGNVKGAEIAPRSETDHCGTESDCFNRVRTLWNCAGSSRNLASRWRPVSGKTSKPSVNATCIILRRTP